MDNAFEYIKDNHGIDWEQLYPYEAKNGKCRYKSASKAADDAGFVDIPAGDEDGMLVRNQLANDLSFDHVYSYC